MRYGSSYSYSGDCEAGKYSKLCNTFKLALLT